ncbi:hypothetical protein MLD38_016339 [Melastoma candidum]|uniref:Uncharacterized protein n=1 Tax=Melastoma candidum TaxID=119954 RepID=A0ACB9RSK1_9MYRT|nr:hypothetical protein MLD38_016339 [Melastoma candidum]
MEEPQWNPFADFLRTNISGLIAAASDARRAALSALAPPPARAETASVAVANVPVVKRGLSESDLEERLAGVPVYALSNGTDEFVLVSGRERKEEKGSSLGLLCLGKEDAEALLQQMRNMDPGMRSGSRVVPLALNKVIQLKVDGVSFRFIPESSQIKHALKLRQKAGFTDEDFLGVPVFQSRSLVLKSEDHSYRPVFFRKEDLENSLGRAARDQNQLNPAWRPGDIQVAVLEEVIKGMKENSNTKWDDVVFIPPGFDISTDPSRLPASGSD